MTKPNPTNDAAAIREWWINAQTTLRTLAGDLDRFAGKAGQREGGDIPFTPAQLRTMEAGIGRALDAVAETVPAV